MGCYCAAISHPPCSYCESHCLCEECDLEYHEDDLVEVGDRILCYSCSDYVDCSSCGDAVHEDDISVDNGEDYCADCIVVVRNNKINKRLFGH
jgi:formylmethanofuran dehydrogenase subunit E